MATPPPPAPSAAGVQIVSAQPSLILGRDLGTTVTVSLAGAFDVAGEVRLVGLFTNVGTLDPPQPGPAPGSFVAEFHVPEEVYPQTALLVAQVLSPAGKTLSGALRIPLLATTEYLLHSTPSADVTLTVADKTFGPERADVRGSVKIPILVPAGAATGTARAVNRFGIEKATTVDLQPHDYSRMVIGAPEVAAAGGGLDVELWGIDAAGEPTPSESLELLSPGLKVTRQGGGSGVARFSVALPQQLGEVVLLGSIRGEAPVATRRVEVIAGPPSTLTITPNSTTVEIGGRDEVRIRIEARDRFGNPAPRTGLLLTAGGQPLSVRDDSPEASEAIFRSPDTALGSDRIPVTAELGALRDGFELQVIGGPPAHVELAPADGATTSVVGDGSSAVDLALVVTDEAGNPTLAPHLAWKENESGTLMDLGAARTGVYIARFVPSRTPRQRVAAVTAVVDPTQPTLRATANINVAPVGMRELAARIGIASYPGRLFGPVAFVEATFPWPFSTALGRLLGIGATTGYIHSEGTLDGDKAASNVVDVEPDGVGLSINQIPIMALARLRLPIALPFTTTVTAMGGMSLATVDVDSTSLTGEPIDVHGVTHAWAFGAGADAGLSLYPGELIVGARYMRTELGRVSSGDRIEGNSIGLIVDVGFRMEL